MATKSIEKNIVITESVERLVNALERSGSTDRVNTPPVLYDPSVEQARRMFAE